VSNNDAWMLGIHLALFVTFAVMVMVSIYGLMINSLVHVVFGVGHCSVILGLLSKKY
jgi:hypothetical protein